MSDTISFRVYANLDTPVKYLKFIESSLPDNKQLFVCGISDNVAQNEGKHDL